VLRSAREKTARISICSGRSDIIEGGALQQLQHVMSDCQSSTDNNSHSSEN